MTEPNSRLTSERPDIWLRALALASDLTGYTYANKTDGGLLACGGGGSYRIQTPEERLRDIDENLDRLRKIDRSKETPFVQGEWQGIIRQWEDRRRGLIREHPELDKKAAPVVYVPEGEMEWLLHEFGHWIVATPEERALPNYGYNQGVLLNGLGAARELQAWGFEDIVLSPFGTSRLFASPTQRDGVAFDWHGPLPDFALRHADRQLRVAGIEVAPWRQLYGEWVRWNAGQRGVLH